MTDYPYMISNNKIGPIIESIQAAAKPAKFTLAFLKSLGFTSTNDRAIVPLLKKLGFLTEDSVPTAYYDQLRDKTSSGKILATRIKELYSELFTVNTNIHEETDTNIKGAISRVTGKDANSVTRIYNTFKALCNLADFSTTILDNLEQDVEVEVEANNRIEEQEIINQNPIQANGTNPSFHYNIQIHLPATTDISVYNAIFKSLKDNLLI